MGVRFGTIDDIDIMHAIMLDAFQEFADEPVPARALTETKEQFAEKLKNGEQVLIVTASDGVDCGIVRFQIIGDILYFYRLSILQRYRGHGLAKRVLIELEREAIRNKVRFIRCKVRHNLSSQVLMYENLGYIQYAEEVQERNGQSIYVKFIEKPLLVRA